MKPSEFIKCLEKMVPEAKCELVYNKDYELLIATMLSAQASDKVVNNVTRKLFSEYSLFDICNCSLIELEKILKPLGTFRKKSIYTKEIAKSLINDYHGIVPNNRRYLETLPGVGHKTCNVVLSNLFDENCLAVDTHVSRVAKRLGYALEDDNVLLIEEKMTNIFNKFNLKDLHHRMVLFGRYVCLAKKPKCFNCLFKDNCKYYKEKLH